MEERNDLPLIRSGERADYKRCVKKWYWTWRMGLVPKAKQFGALDLGTWVHAALAEWYGEGRKRNGKLADHLDTAAFHALVVSADANAPDHVIKQGEELRALGIEMATAYERTYGRDKNIIVLAAEIPLEFSIPDSVTGELMAVHKLKPDLVYMDWETGDIWLMEHKTAKSISTEHLVIDDQARPYGAMASRSLRRLGIISHRSVFRGIMYNFLRKALPDTRRMNAEGKYLNKNGSVSKTQPPPYFLRKPVTMTTRGKRITLMRLQRETANITQMTALLRSGEISPAELDKTPHKSCPRFCPFFAMCVAEEEGTDPRLMEQTLYIRRNPYLYEEENETANEPVGFEMG